MTSTRSRAVRAQLLAQTPLFGGLPGTLLDELSSGGKSIELPPHARVYSAGEAIRQAHLLCRGSVKRTVRPPGQAERIIELADTPQLLGIGEILGDSRYHSSCEVIQPSTLVTIDVERLRAAIARHAELGRRIARVLALKLCTAEGEMVGHTASVTGTQRVLDYLLKLAGENAPMAGETTVALGASKRTIAARIGVRPESLSRSLKVLSDSGVIAVEGRTVHIQNAAVLDTRSDHSTDRVRFARRRGLPISRVPRTMSPGALVNACGRLRVLSQRMAIAWALIRAGVGTEKAWVRLRMLDAEFTRNLDRLAAVALDAPVADAVREIARRWPDYRLLLFDTQTGPGDAARVFESSEAVLRAADDLTNRAEATVSNPDARWVNVAGRNRMLSQRIGKCFLFQDWPGCGDVTQSLIRESCEGFDRNLSALRDHPLGPPELGAQIGEVAFQWGRFMKSMAPDLALTNRSQRLRAVLAECDRLFRHTDTLVKLYERIVR